MKNPFRKWLMGQPRVITADHEMVVPVGKVIEVDVTSQDVFHSFSVPSFGVKIDASRLVRVRPAGFVGWFGTPFVLPVVVMGARSL